MNLFAELAKSGVEVRESTTDETEIKLCCPFCVDMGTSPDYKFRLGINIVSGLGHCFNCGWNSKKAVLEIARKFGLGNGAVQEILATPWTGQSRKRPEKTELPEGFQLLSEVDTDDPLFGAAKQYVRKRGITEEQLERYEIGATVEDWKFRYRVIFPVRSKEGKLLGLIGRDWTGRQEPKYLNSIGTKGVFNARPDLYPKGKVIASEGVTKALAIERAVDNKFCSVALCGKNITDAQVQQLKGFQEVILFPDPDRDGMTGFLGVAANLQSVFERVSMSWPWPKKQADDLTRKEIRAALRSRRKYNDILVLRIKQEMRSR
jgi:DNA primase